MIPRTRAMLDAKAIILRELLLNAGDGKQVMAGSIVAAKMSESPKEGILFFNAVQLLVLEGLLRKGVNGDGESRVLFTQRGLEKALKLSVEKALNLNPEQIREIEDAKKLFVASIEY